MRLWSGGRQIARLRLARFGLPKSVERDESGKRSLVDGGIGADAPALRPPAGCGIHPERLPAVDRIGFLPQNLDKPGKLPPNLRRADRPANAKPLRNDSGKSRLPESAVVADVEP